MGVSTLYPSCVHSLTILCPINTHLNQLTDLESNALRTSPINNIPFLFAIILRELFLAHTITLSYTTSYLHAPMTLHHQLLILKQLFYHLQTPYVCYTTFI